MKYLVLFTLIFSSSSFACSCVVEETPYYFKIADSVFIAEVIDSENLNDSMNKYSLDLLWHFKGETYDAVTSASGFPEGTSCDYDMERGQIYLFMLGHGNSVQYCSGTKPIEESDIEKIKKEISINES